MLGLEELDLALLLADAELVEAAVQDFLGRSQLQDLLNANQNIKDLLKGKIDKWRGKVTKEVEAQFAQASMAEEVALYQKVVHYSEQEFIDKIDAIWDDFEPSFVFYETAERLLFQDNAKQNLMLPHYFCQQWHQALEERVKSLQEDVVKAQTQGEIAALEQQMHTLQQMAQISAIDDSSKILGRIWDMASGSLTQGDFDKMRTYAEFLKKNPKLLEIAKELGRHASPEEEEDTSQAASPEYQEAVSEFALDDITGTTVSDDLNKLLPNETLFLAYPELEVIFYQHLAEKRLQTYHMQGKHRKRMPVAAHKSSDGSPQVEQGPFVICLDASGSMRGFAEDSAKALSFALMQIALAQGRECFVIMFSKNQISYELTKQDGLREVSDFLSYTFHGGTDLEGALQTALEAMEKEKFALADLVVVSDFIAPKHSKPLREQVAKMKRQKNVFHAVNLSHYGDPQVLDIFDKVWDFQANFKQKIFGS